LKGSRDNIGNHSAHQKLEDIRYLKIFDLLLYFWRGELVGIFDLLFKSLLIDNILKIFQSCHVLLFINKIDCYLFDILNKVIRS